MFLQLVLNGDKRPEAAKARTPKVRKRKKVSEPELEDATKDSLCIDDQSFSKVLTTSMSKKKREKGEKALSVDQLNTRRKRLWQAIVRKEVGKAHKSRNYNMREKVTNGKRVATQCMRAVRQKAMQSQRVTKETVWRAKRLTREMQVRFQLQIRGHCGGRAASLVARCERGQVFHLSLCYALGT